MDLLPKSQKVDVSLDGEQISVPDGKVWKVKVITDDRNASVINDASGETKYVIQYDEAAIESSVSVTLHEGWSVDGDVGITGWEFNYE